MPEKQMIVALVGPPNAGKTTLYNWLTASKYKTVNYPGATVEYSVAKLAGRYQTSLNGENLTADSVSVIDTPGTYSLFPKSEDEEVTVKTLYHHPEFKIIDHVIAVVDATQISRQLLLAQQLKEAGFHVIIALTMADLVRKFGKTLDMKKLSEYLGCSVIACDGLLGSGIPELVKEFRGCEELNYQVKQTTPWSKDKTHEIIQANHKFLASMTVKGAGQDVQASTQKIDGWLLHPWFGPLLFFGIMTLLFSSIFVAAAPLMDAIDALFSLLSNKVIAASAGALWGSFVGKGLIASFSTVMVFVPQIFILFLGVSFLENSGYLARAATLVDRPLSALGLGGRSFVPLLSGFACAVPAMMATRNLSSARDRWITVFIIPLMTCSARLPVYALLLGFVFRDKPAWYGGLALALVYMSAILIGAVAAKILDKILPKENRSFFMMELPLYRRPRMRVVVQQAYSKTMGYVKRAGLPIFIFALLLWGLSTFPNYNAANDHDRLEQSYAGHAGHFIEPVFRPMGVDWRVGVGLISAFAAREVFVSSLGVIFNVTSENDEGLRAGLLNSMSSAVNSEGRPIFTFASVIALIIFVTVALQCTATTAMAIKEMASVRFAVVQLVSFNIAAYLLAVASYQILSRLSGG